MEVNKYTDKAKHLVAVDCIVFGYDLIEKEINLLLVKRMFEPSKGKWSLAGGFVESFESLDDAASRILRDFIYLW
jgi:8-oxo-dGTP diphosphatase